jgi:hypothetical protein
MSLRFWSDTHSKTIGTPLILILFFCFSFILLHPVHPDKVQTVSAESSSRKKDPTSSQPTTSLPTIPIAQTSLQTLSPAQPAANDGSTGSSSSAGTSAGSAATSPSAASNSGAVHSQPASPVQNATQTHGKSLIGGVTGIVKSLTNL